MTSEEDKKEAQRQYQREWRRKNPNYQKEWHKNNPERAREYAKEFRESNPNYFRERNGTDEDNYRIVCPGCEKRGRKASFSVDSDVCLDCEQGPGSKSREAANRHNKKKYSTPGYIKEQTLKKFNMSPEEYDRIRERQEYCCAACGVHETELDRGLAVDHDHSCCDSKTSCGDCTRGLLCNACNMTEGLFKDNPERLLGLFEYMMKK